MRNAIAIKSVLFWLFLFQYATYSKGQAKRYANFVSSYTVYKFDDSLRTTDSSFHTFMKQYEDSLDNYVNEKIILSENPLTKAQPESSMGNWITDALKESLNKKIKVHICLVSYSSIGLDYLAPGVITRKDIYKLIPQRNKLLLFQLSGREIEQVCDSIALIGGIPISGISFMINGTRATKILINKQPINEHLVYTVVVDETLVYHKKFTSFFKGQKPIQINECLRELVEQYTYEMKTQNKNIKAEIDNRISYAE